MMMIAGSEKVMKGLGNISYSASAPITPGQRKAAIFCIIYNTHQSQYHYFNFFLTIITKVLIKAIFPKMMTKQG